MGNLKAYIERVTVLEPEKGCWNYKGYVRPNGKGYPMLWHERRRVSGHRLCYEVFNGPISDGLVVRHTCDNNRCLNPNHLITGTQKDNLQDMVQRGRAVDWAGRRKGNANPNAKLNQELVGQIKGMLDIVPRKLIAQEYGISYQNICAIATGRSWND